MKRVLLLDDDADVRALLKTALGALGLEVVEARRAGDAERLLQQLGPVDVAVVDGLLPDGPGLEFVERLRGRDRQVRVVFLSAYYRDVDTFQQLTQELDVSLVAYKPVEPERFAAQIAGLAGAREAAEAGPAKEVVIRAPHPTAMPLGPALAALYRQFTEQLPAKIGAIEDEVTAARTDPRRLARARDLVHALHGSAGSYGFAAVSESMGIAEYLLADAAAQGATQRPYFWEELQASLREARAAHARALAALRASEPQEGPR
ncbi:MAG TPA: response regulator [Myxococcaceae bacterium]|nr:response regulator [Myxococcaceae bacterium]